MSISESLYFESHITIDPVLEDDAKIGLLRVLVKGQGFRIAELLMRNGSGEHSREDSFMTGRSKDLPDLSLRTQNLVTQLKEFGFRVRRYKIESALVDSKVADTLNLL